MLASPSVAVGASGLAVPKAADLAAVAPHLVVCAVLQEIAKRVGTSQHGAEST